MSRARRLVPFAIAASLAIVVAVLLHSRARTHELPEPPTFVLPAGVPRVEPLAVPAGRDLDWRAAVQVEPDAAGKPVRAAGDPARVAHVFGFVHTPDGQLAKSVRVEWSRKPQSTLQVSFSQPPGSTDSPGEPRSFDVVDGHYEGDVPEGTWVVSANGLALTDDLKNYAPFAAPVPLLRRLTADSRTQIDFDFRPVGTCSVQGTIRDEEGQPFGGLTAGISELHELVDPSTGKRIVLPQGVANAASAHSTGSFTLSGLPPGRFQLYVEPEGYKPMSPPDEGRVGEVVPFRELVLVDGRLTVELTIRRPHPVQVTGRVEIDASWAAEHGLAGQTPTLELVRESGREGIPDVRDPVQLTADTLEFWFWLDAGVLQPKLELHLGSESNARPLILPRTGDLASYTVRLPR